MSEDTTEVTVEGLQAELEKARKALSKANAEAKTYRERAEALESDDSVKVWKDKALKAEIKAALREQGVHDTDRVLKVLNLEGVDIDDDGKLTGLDEKVGTTKKEWPELFDNKRRVGGGADIFAEGEPKTTMTSTEAQVARLLSNV